MAQEILFTDKKAAESGPVECLGMTFENDEARRAYFLERLREKLRDPEFRKIPGFPQASDEDILRLSDPPYYTACPNPFIKNFIESYGHDYDSVKDRYHREPFTADVSEGKNDPIYNAHSYHTKVPHKAIMRYILHYTDPGDVIFDGFCGTGMAGVAAALCEELGSERTPSMPGATRGRRSAILCDLSPIATFIASNLLRPFSRADYLDALDLVCREVDCEFGYLYQTRHTGWKVRDRKHVEHRIYIRQGAEFGSVEFTLYSDVVACPECGNETTYYDLAVDEGKDALRSELTCMECGATVPESGWEPVFNTIFDPILDRPIRQARIQPVLINYSVGSTRYEKRPDDYDLYLSEQAVGQLRAHGLPPVELISGKETQRNVPKGVTHLHHFFTPREHLFVAALLRQIEAIPDSDLRFALLFALTATLPYASRMRRFRADRKGGGPLSGTLYVSSLVTPPHVIKTFRRNAETIADSLSPPVDLARRHVISTQSATWLGNIPENSIDYIFTDPPFGHNFDYSELNFFWEGVLRVVTNQDPEAIVSAAQGKGVAEYRSLMEKACVEFYRILKPGRWITVEFSNTKASVWNAIQTALANAGFVIANVASLDKQQHSFKAVMTPTAAKQDLIISAYKPTAALEERFAVQGGMAEAAWQFTRNHLKQLPVFLAHQDEAEVILERQAHMLYERMVAFHVQRGIAVPLSAAEFFAGLGQRFDERDGMYFLPEQVVEYDRRRSRVSELKQLELFVTDEASAIQWLRQQLHVKPQTFQDLQPTFMKELQAWAKYERTIELKEILEQNFLRYDGKGPVPSQIHSYLSSNYKSLRGLDKEDPRLVAEARDRWYVPDPAKQGDLEKLREKALLREFEEYRTTKQRKLKVFRTEAVRAGFKAAYEARDYRTIVDVAAKLPESVLQEDEKLLMYYDVATMRLGE